jgi:hypothetical protein
VSVVAEGGTQGLELRNGDPFDYARAMRAFPESAKVRVEIVLKPAQTEGRLEIDLCDAAGRRPVRVVLTAHPRASRLLFLRHRCFSKQVKGLFAAAVLVSFARPRTETLA